MNRNRTCAGILLDALAGAIAPALAAQDLPTALTVYRAHENDVQRLACCGRDADKLMKDSSMNAMALSVAAQTTRSRFGYRGALGLFLLSGFSKKSTRVTRVR